MILSSEILHGAGELVCKADCNLRQSVNMVDILRSGQEFTDHRRYAIPRDLFPSTSPAVPLPPQQPHQLPKTHTRRCSPLWSTSLHKPRGHQIPAPAMKILRTVSEMRAYRSSLPPHTTVGFVPTMGALHDGHLTLVDRSVSETSITIASIFVNPAQFAPGEDLASYPRTEADDLALCKQRGVTVVFMPERDDVYPPDFDTWVTTGVGSADRNPRSEGKSRPTFFRGVATVLTKLFALVRPHAVYFGQKDAQQCAVVKRLVQDMWMDVRVVVCDTVREHDGLAMSSRNAYLTAEERKEAASVYSALKSGLEMVRGGCTDVEAIRAEVRRLLERGAIRLLYVSVCDRSTMREVASGIGEKECLLCVAAMLGKARLIDNVVLDLGVDR